MESIDRLERRLQWNLALLVVLGASLLSGVEGGGYLTIVALIGAATSLILVDSLRWFYLGRLSSNIIALFVAFYPLLDFFDKANEAQLMSIAQLLVHLQVVLLLERKTPRIYWQIFVLSVLQVVVSSALRFDLQGGVLYLVYAIVASSAMVFMLAHRDQDRVRQSRILAQKRRDETEKLVDGEKPEAILFARGVLMGDSHPVPNPLLTAFHWRAVGLSLMAIFFSSVLFYMIPRAGEPWVNRRGVKVGQVGFTDRLTFDETTQLQEPEDSVLRVSYFDPRTGKPVAVAGGVYLRGTTLHYYGMVQGQPSWVEGAPGDGILDNATSRDLPILRGSDADLLRQVIRMAPSGDRYLFTDVPCFFLDDGDSRFGYDRKRNALALDPMLANVNESIEYELAIGSYKPVRSQGDSIFNRNRFFPYLNGNRRTASMGPVEMQELLQLPLDRDFRTRFPTLSQLAQDWAEGLPVNDPLSVMLEYEQRLRSGDFSYTLDFSKVQRDSTLDPIEDFVRNHHQGHCEYFASTLALMLRSRGVPCRIVVGYRAGFQDFNSMGGFYDVQMKNTHVWVEAYLRPDRLSADLASQPLFARAGCWVHLDPTPGTSEMLDNNSAASLTQRADQALGYAQMIWDDYVVGLDQRKQNESFGGRLRGLFDVSTLEYALERAFSGTASAGSVTLLFGVLMVFLLASSFAKRKRGSPWASKLLSKGAQKWLKRTSPRLARWVGLSPQSTVQKSIAFYQQLEDLLAKMGWERRLAETPKEFGARLEEAWKERPASQEMKTIVGELIHDYYEVRYGSRALDTVLLARTQVAMERLKQLLIAPIEPSQQTA